jgi:hypothetical protein
MTCTSNKICKAMQSTPLRPCKSARVLLTSLRKVSLEGRNSPYHAPRLFFECAYSVQDASTVLSGQRTWIILLWLRPSLPGVRRWLCRSRGLHELLIIAAKRIALAILLPIDAHTLAARYGQRPDAQTAAHLALQRSRRLLRSC